MTPMTVATYNAHTPWIWMLAAALPEVRFRTLPYLPHTPDGWRDDQRPMLPNVEPAHTESEVADALEAADVVICHTLRDLERTPEGAAVVFVAHNHAAFSEPWLIQGLNRQRIPVVAISLMKARSWLDAGFRGRLAVIHPYVDPGWFLPRAPDAHLVYLTVCNDITRPLFDLGWWGDMTEPLADLVGAVQLVGGGNGTLTGAMGASPSWDALRALYAAATVYLNPCCEPYEDAHNLAALEAHAAGVPVVARQREKWRLLVAEHNPFDPFDKKGFREAWLAVLGEASLG